MFSVEREKNWPLAWWTLTNEDQSPLTVTSFLLNGEQEAPVYSGEFPVNFGVGASVHFWENNPRNDENNFSYTKTVVFIDIKTNRGDFRYSPDKGFQPLSSKEEAQDGELAQNTAQFNSRIESAKNLQKIGAAILLWANDNAGNYPPDLGALIKNQNVTIKCFVFPGSPAYELIDDRFPIPESEQSSWINEHSDYIYLGAGANTNAGADVILAYEKGRIGGGAQIINLLFADGHVEAQSVDEAHIAIQYSRMKLNAVGRQ